MQTNKMPSSNVKFVDNIHELDMERQFRVFLKYGIISKAMKSVFFQLFFILIVFSRITQNYSTDFSFVFRMHFLLVYVIRWIESKCFATVLASILTSEPGVNVWMFLEANQNEINRFIMLNRWFVVRIYHKAQFVPKTSTAVHAFPSSFEIRHVHSGVVAQCVSVRWYMSAYCACCNSINVFSEHMSSQRFLVLCPSRKRKLTLRNQSNRKRKSF